MQNVKQWNIQHRLVFFSRFFNGDETFLFIFVRNSKNSSSMLSLYSQNKAVLTGESGSKRICPDGIPELVMAPQNTKFTHIYTWSSQIKRFTQAHTFLHSMCAHTISIYLIWALQIFLSSPTYTLYTGKQIPFIYKYIYIIKIQESDANSSLQFLLVSFSSFWIFLLHFRTSVCKFLREKEWKREKDCEK